MDHAPVPIRISGTLPSGVNALYQPDTREIQVRRGMDGSFFYTLRQLIQHTTI